MKRLKQVAAFLGVLTIFEFICLVRAQIPTLTHPVNIPNCVESILDNNGVERCQICQAGFTKSYDMSQCILSTLKGCIWQSKWGCLECQCGFVATYDLTKCVQQQIEGCLRLDKTGKGCIQPKIGYTVTYSQNNGVFSYQSIQPDQGQYCGWQLSGTTGCTMCQVGFYLETGGNSCKKLSRRLQNEHSFWLASNDMTTPTTAIQVIPGWQSIMLGLTNAGAFEAAINGCVQYDDFTNRYNNVALCVQCSKGQVKTQNQLQCVSGDSLCDYADNTTFKCIKCKDPLNYYADQITNKCLMRNQMFDNCAIRQPAADKCDTCNSNGYILDASNKCIYIDNCQTSNGKTQCTNCNQQFYLDSGNTVCSPLPPNCSVGTTAACTTCSSGYYKGSDGNCYQMTPYCTAVDPATYVCNNCQSQYHLFNNSCYQNIPNCVTYFTTGINGCQICQSMYTPSPDFSVCLLHNLQFQEYCQSTDGKGNCLQCQSLKYIPQCLDITNANLCLVSDGKANKCIQCLPNAFLNSSNICYPAYSQCLRTDGQSKCMQCQMGYYIDPTTFQCVAIASCSISDGLANICLACQQGYILVNNQCQLYIAGCLIQTSNGGTTTCLQCQSGYAKSGNTCTQIQNCLISDGISNKCYQCVPNMQLDTTSTSTTSQCIVFNPNPIYQPPQFCSVFYMFIPGTTQLKDAVCTNLYLKPKYGYCLQCQSPLVLQLSIDGTTCANSSAVTQSCVNINTISILIDNCRVYDFTPGKCRICENNYAPDVNGNCVIQPAISNCQNTIDPLNFKNAVNCQICLPGVYLNSNTCLIAVQNCQTYNASGCNACQANFVLSSNLCVPFAGQLCTGYTDSSNTVCTTCKSGYEYKLPSNPNLCLYNPYLGPSAPCSNIVVRDPINNPYCLNLSTLPDPNCQEYNSSGVCSKCKSTYLLQKSTNNQIYLICVPKSANCSAVNTNGQVCQTCSANYLLNTSFNGADCIQVNHCINPTGQGDGTGCLECDHGGYYVDSSRFLCNQIQDCVTTDGINPFCLKCISLKYPSIGGVCVDLNMNGCIQSSGINQTCSQCGDKYYLNSNGICQLGTVLNCLKYSPLNNPTQTNVCAQCQPGFKLNASFACDQIPNCAQSDGSATAVCTKCQDYFYFKTSTSQCLPPDNPINYCRIYTNDTQQCSECDIPFYLVGQICYPRSNKNDYCKAYSLTDTPCILCSTQGIGGVIVQDDHSLKKGFCNPISINNCNIYQQNSPKCQFCNQVNDGQQGWLVQSKNYCKDVSQMNCLTLNPQGTKCSSCQQGVNAYLKSYGQCFPLCPSNQYLVPDANITNPPTCQNYTPARITNCDQPDPVNDACLLCSLGYVFNTTTKTCQQMQVSNCINNGSERGETCYQCAPNYYLVKNACIQSSPIQNCSTYVITTGLCGLCANGYYLSTDFKSCKQITAQNCKYNQIDSDTCLLCKDNTYTISQDGKQCFTGRSTSHCIVSATTSNTSECSLCESGYITETGKQNCILDIFNLPGCSAVQKLASNSYYTCSACQPNYNLRNNICIPSQGLSTCYVANCQFYSSYLYDSATCQSCISIQDGKGQYQLQNNSCVFVQTGTRLAFIMILLIGLTFLLL
ncbi:AT hook motif protein (macronuclear) [Tetrahymena thermophila SB210]|uniref:AT hook motif protein n=1 Tax=Tetrahymena thermophila (strain SB210) TaxID=312017 RepID=Q24BW9_TETTS|nr:AT hook motif protein [Tetrahymena thermophila SB210]EAS05268.2 AT hook motif protein [Tetrahymena thermophila SB210]|eukprot:XP_001025513.2 AT hook motif protein [Tetrahymena thermophila SB210]